MTDKIRPEVVTFVHALLPDLIHDTNIRPTDWVHKDGRPMTDHERETLGSCTAPELQAVQRLCELAGVEPEFETYKGDDPDGYALAVNVARRNLTVGQRAMIVARSQGYSSGITQHASARSAGVSQPAVAKARVVLKHAPDLAEAHMSLARQEVTDLERVTVLCAPYFALLPEGSVMGQVLELMPEAERNEVAALMDRLTLKDRLDGPPAA